jgi:queuosine precursor transporter
VTATARGGAPVGFVALTGYVATIVLANVFLGHVGLCPPPGQLGPCVLPVGFGLYAPSGVLWVGAALFLRDVVQDALGRRWAITGILVGAVLSWLVAAPGLALASGVAFLLSEAADFAVYTPLRERHLRWQGVLASGVVGSLVDSVVFLWLAFGSLAFLAGQFVGKTEITLSCAALVWLWSVRRQQQRVSAEKSARWGGVAW